MTDLIDAPAERAGLAGREMVTDAPTASLGFPPPALNTLGVSAFAVVATPEPVVAAPEPVVAAPEPVAVETPAATPAAAPAGILSGPANILSPDPSMAPLDLSVPALPSQAAAPPPNTAVAALGAGGKGPLDIDVFDAPPPKHKKKKAAGGAGRGFRRLILVALLGAGTWFGVQRGPALYEQYVVGDEVANEPEAPLAFPRVNPEIPAVRYAQFTLSNLTGAPDTTYDVTTDFETNVTRVQVTRESGPDLEVLTFGDSAFVKNVNSPQWYELDRGGFPLQDRLERGDWVRHVDEFLPVADRGAVTIDRSTESSVQSVPTRRLLLSLDGSTLGTASLPPVDMTEEPGAPAGDAVVIESFAPTVDVADDPMPPGTATQIEIWVDADGIIRQISGAPQLGAETITVVATGSDPWVPDYPSVDQVAPLTASALIELGI